MKNTIKLNNEIGIDLDKVIESKLAILANSGGGKSYATRRIIEQAAGKVQIIIIDPESEYANLRQKYDFVLAGEGGETIAQPRMAGKLAERLMQLKASAIIDIYDLLPQDRKRFVHLFLESLMNLPKHLQTDVLLIVDEAHVFAPEGKPSETSSAMEALASQGRKRNIGAIFVTQRIAKLSKDVLAECNNKMIGRMNLDIDRKRAGEELGLTNKEDVLALRNLKPGEFHVFGPAIADDPILTKVGEVSILPPKRGAANSLKVAPPTAAVKKILAQLADLPQEAAKEAQTVAELKKQLAEAHRHRCPVVQQNPVKIERINVPMVGKKTLEGMKTALLSYRQLATKTKQSASIIDEAVNRLAFELAKIEKISQPAAAFRSSTRPTVEQNPERTIPQRTVSPALDTSEFKPSGSAQKILNALAWLESRQMTPASKNQLAFLSDQKSTSGGYFNNLGALRSNGLITYPQQNMVDLTAAGRALAEIPQQPMDEEGLHQQIRAKVTAAQWVILQQLIQLYPNSISKDELAGCIGVQPTSGGYFNNLGALRTLGLIDYPTPGMVVALKTLFI